MTTLTDVQYLPSRKTTPLFRIEEVIDKKGDNCLCASNQVTGKLQAKALYDTLPSLTYIHLTEHTSTVGSPLRYHTYFINCHGLELATLLVSLPSLDQALPQLRQLNTCFNHPVLPPYLLTKTSELQTKLTENKI